jgi:hypothetical protein
VRLGGMISHLSFPAIDKRLFDAIDPALLSSNFTHSKSGQAKQASQTSSVYRVRSSKELGGFPVTNSEHFYC